MTVMFVSDQKIAETSSKHNHTEAPIQAVPW